MVASFLFLFFFKKRESGLKNILSSISYSQICEYISLLGLSLFTEKSLLTQGYADLNAYYVFLHSTKTIYNSHISNNNLSETGWVYHQFHPLAFLFREPQTKKKKKKKEHNKISIDCGISLRQDRISSSSPPFLEKRAWHLSGITKGRFSDLQKLMTDNEKGFQCSRWQGYKSEPLSSQLRWLWLQLKLLFRSHFWLVPNSKSVPSQTNSQK